MSDRKWQDVKMTGVSPEFTDVVNWAVAESTLVSITEPTKPQSLPVKRISIRLGMEDGSAIDHEVKKEGCIIRIESSRGEFYEDENGNEKLRVTGQTISLSGIAGDTICTMPDGTTMSAAQAMATMFKDWLP